MKEDIDKINICREVIDKSRAFNKARGEAINTAKTIDEAKAILESKLGVATSIPSDTSVKSRQYIITVLEGERTKYTLEMNRVLKEQGFESFGAFSKWYNDLILELYKECHPIVGKCDFCGESELKNQPCVIPYSKDACVSKSPDTNDIIYTLALGYERNGTYLDITGKRYGTKECGGCPPGHGFYSDLANYKEPPDGIDFMWRI